jgi:hypothetical protein
MHYSNIADYTGVYEKLEYVFDATGGKIVVDSAFKLRNNPYLIQMMQTLAHTRDEILFQRGCSEALPECRVGDEVISVIIP